jgi:hypothetical protein
MVARNINKITNPLLNGRPKELTAKISNQPQIAGIPEIIQA